MISKPWVLLLLAGVPAVADDCKPRPVDAAVAKELAGITARTHRACPALPNVANLCMAVGDKYSERDPALKTRYAYQNQIYAASCVEPDDTPEMVRGKVQHFWNTFHPRLSCAPLGFSVRNGHLLKLAVETNSQDFIEEAVLDWQLDLNHVDAADGRTVLDYVRDEQKLAEGTGRGRMFKRYFDLLRDEGGARFKSER